MVKKAATAAATTPTALEHKMQREMKNFVVEHRKGNLMVVSISFFTSFDVTMISHTHKCTNTYVLICISVRAYVHFKHWNQSSKAKRILKKRDKTAMPSHRSFEWH